MRVAAVLLAWLALADAAAAKDFETMVLVGSNGDSAVVHGDTGVLDGFFDSSRGLGPVVPTPAGEPYVQLYLLGPGGLPGIPGRFYPRSFASCFSWDRTRPSAICHQPPPPLLELLRAGDRLEPLQGVPTTIAALGRSRAPFFRGSANLEVALEMAFGRARASRSAPRRPAQCIELRSRWRGPGASSRPARFCLSPRGASWRGRLYPLGRGVWSFARANA